jgi:hypothetical protein
MSVELGQQSPHVDTTPKVSPSERLLRHAQLFEQTYHERIRPLETESVNGEVLVGHLCNSHTGELREDLSGYLSEQSATHVSSNPEIVQQTFSNFVRETEADLSKYMQRPEGDFPQTLLRIDENQKAHIVGGVKSFKCQSDNAIEQEAIRSNLGRLMTANLLKSYRKYVEQFDIVPDIHVSDHEYLPGKRAIQVSISIGAMIRLGILEGEQGGQLLRLLEQEHHVANPTLLFSVPVESGEDASTALRKLPQLFQEAELFRSGWYSTPFVWFREALCKRSDDEMKFPLTTLYDDAASSIDPRGKRRVMIGLAGIGCQNSVHEGTPTAKGAAEGLKFDVHYQMHVTRDLLHGIGARVHHGIGHSRAGYEALYGPEYFPGSTWHAWNPAALPPWDVARLRRVRGFMKSARFLNSGWRGSITKHIVETKPVKETVIRFITGQPQGIEMDSIRSDHANIIRTALGNGGEVANEYAMMMMELGSGPTEHEQVMNGELPSTEKTLLTTLSTGDTDYFVRTWELWQRQRMVYRDLLLTKGLAEDFGVHRKDPRMRMRKAYENQKTFSQTARDIFMWQLLGHDHGGHYNFYDERFREALAKSVYEAAAKRRFDLTDFILATAVQEFPVVLSPEFDENNRSPWSITLLSDGRPRVVRVSMEQYEKVRLLLGYVDQTNGDDQRDVSMWDRYRQKRKETIDRLDWEQVKNEVEQVISEGSTFHNLVMPYVVGDLETWKVLPAIRNRTDAIARRFDAWFDAQTHASVLASISHPIQERSVFSNYASSQRKASMYQDIREIAPLMMQYLRDHEDTVDGIQLGSNVEMRVERFIEGLNDRNIARISKAGTSVSRVILESCFRWDIANTATHGGLESNLRYLTNTLRDYIHRIDPHRIDSNYEAESHEALRTCTLYRQLPTGVSGAVWGIAKRILERDDLKILY